MAQALILHLFPLRLYQRRVEVFKNSLGIRLNKLRLGYIQSKLVTHLLFIHFSSLSYSISFLQLSSGRSRNPSLVSGYKRSKKQRSAQSEMHLLLSYVFNLPPSLSFALSSPRLLHLLSGQRQATIYIRQTKANITTNAPKLPKRSFSTVRT